MNFLLFHYITGSLLHRRRKTLEHIAFHIKETLRNDMKVTILSHKISFVNYFAAEK